MDNRIKFQSLQLGQSYTVIGCESVKSKFGDTYILQVVDEDDNEFELWSTPFIDEFINKMNNNKKFKFIVRKMNNDMLIPEIEGYIKRKFIMYED